MYLLDTNIASYAINGDPPEVRRRLAGIPPREIAVSAVTQGELVYGLERRANNLGLTRLVDEFLVRVEVLPWTSVVAKTYGRLRAQCAARGVALGALDMLIAAQAIAAHKILITHDSSFLQIGGELRCEDWL